MDRLKKRLFVTTYRYRKQWQRYEDSDYYTELEVLAAKSAFQVMYRFLKEEGLEDEYLAWVNELEDEMM